MTILDSFFQPCAHKLLPLWRRQMLLSARTKVGFIVSYTGISSRIDYFTRWCTVVGTAAFDTVIVITRLKFAVATLYKRRLFDDCQDPSSCGTIQSRTTGTLISDTPLRLPIDSHCTHEQGTDRNT